MTYNKGTKSTGPAKSGSTAGGSTVMVQSVIQGLFIVVAGRVGEHWVLTDEEATAIAEPAANIIGKYLDTDKLAKYSDPAALAFALGAVMLPRVMIQIQNKPKKEVKPNVPINGSGGQPKPDTSRKGATSSGTDGGIDKSEPPGDSGADAKADVEKLLRDALNSPY